MNTNTPSSQELITALDDCKPFYPIAEYCENTEVLTIQLRDCSTYEETLISGIALLYDNHPDEDEERLVGIVVTRAEVLLAALELPMGTGKMSATSLLCDMETWLCTYELSDDQRAAIRKLQKLTEECGLSFTASNA